MNTTDLAQLHTDGVITTREHEILALRARGLSQNTIALGLKLSRSTVRNHERNGHRKINLHRQETAA
jgi:DNA-binding CsgD family transcriptional regulator